MDSKYSSAIRVLIIDIIEPEEATLFEISKFYRLIFNSSLLKLAIKIPPFSPALFLKLVDLITIWSYSS